MFNIEEMKLERGFWYLGSPYTKYPGGIESAFREAAKATAWLIERGVPVFCPIAHTHPVAIHGGIDPKDHAIWMPADAPFMEAAHGIIVCKMESWKESYGLKCEIEHFERAGKPIRMMDWPQPFSRKPLIGLSGYAKSGKDTAAQALTAIGWQRLAFADAVRESLLAIDPVVEHEHARVSELVNDIGWDDSKKIGEVRQLLQRTGTEAGRNIHGPDCWIDIVAKQLIGQPTVITDCRFANEFALIRQRGGIVVQVVRPGVGPVNEHVSEQLPEPDLRIVNNGTIEDLHAILLWAAEVRT